MMNSMYRALGNVLILSKECAFIQILEDSILRNLFHFHLKNNYNPLNILVIKKMRDALTDDNSRGILSSFRLNPQLHGEASSWEFSPRGYVRRALQHQDLKSAEVHGIPET